MTSAVSTLTIRFSTAGSATYRFDLEGPDVSEQRGSFVPSYNAATWQAVRRGYFDWSHIAMRYWPDRVRAKCVTNKSFTIAHGVTGE